VPVLGTIPPLGAGMSGLHWGWVVSRSGPAGKGDKENPTVPGGTMGAGLRATSPGARVPI
jgi:hypothetical protein